MIDTEWVKLKVAQSYPTLCNLMGLVHGRNSLGQNTGVGSISLLQGIFPTQGSNPGLLHNRWVLYQLSHKGKSRNTGVDSLSFLLWIFLTQELSRGLLYCRRIPYQQSNEGSQLWGKPAMIDTGISKVISRSITCCLNLIL